MLEATAIASPLHAAIGDAIEGGFYAGRICVGSDVFALIVAPKAEGTTKLPWGKYGEEVSGACSPCDGLANTIALAETGSKLAKWAQALSIGGHTDWYVPSLDELELIYRNLKPGTQANWCYLRSGINQNSDPVGLPYSAELPKQTDVSAFHAGGNEAMEAVWHWSSTQYSAYGAWYQTFDGGVQSLGCKDYEGRVRAARRFKLNP